MTSEYTKNMLTGHAVGFSPPPYPETFVVGRPSGRIGGLKAALQNLFLRVIRHEVRVVAPIVRNPCLESTIVLLCLLFFLTGPALAAAIKVTPDRDPVRMNETFNLVFSSEESVDDDPDFSPLAEDFEILGQNQGSQFSIINGNLSKKQEWTLTLSPRRAGAIAIPSIAFGSDRSQPARITVLESGAAVPAPGGDEDNAEIKLEVDVEPRDLYVQAQAIITVRVLLRVNLAGGDLSEPKVNDALVERLGEDRHYSTHRGGREYVVTERKYAVFPQKSGLLQIDPLQLTAQVDAGGRSFFSRPTRALRVRSEAIDLKVRSIPPEFTGKHWLPAANLKLEETWQQEPPRTKAGEPITRTLTLRAQGSTVGVLPELGSDLNLDPSIKQYPDQPALNEEKDPAVGISGVRQEKTALIPARPGEYELSAVEIPWWNTRTDRMEIARIPGRVLKVEASGEPAPQTAPPATAPQAAAQPASSMSTDTTRTQLTASENGWFWLALFLGVGWLGTGFFWWWSHRKTRPPKPIQPAKPRQLNNERLARKALQIACASHDPVSARQALLDWAGALRPGQRPAALADVANLADGALAEEIALLNRALYGHAGKDWRGDRLWAAVEAVSKNKAKSEQEQPGLAPLYPLRQP